MRARSSLDRPTRGATGWKGAILVAGPAIQLKFHTPRSSEIPVPCVYIVAYIKGFRMGSSSPPGSGKWEGGRGQWEGEGGRGKDTEFGNYVGKVGQSDQTEWPCP